MNALELGERVHRQFEHLLSSSPWTFVPDHDDRDRLRFAGIKSKKRRYDLKPFIVPVFPRWAVELLDHPQCSKRVLNGALKNVEYRKVVLMETRLAKKAKRMRLAQERGRIVCHQTAVQPSYTKRDVQLSETWKKLWPEMKRILCGMN